MVIRVATVILRRYCQIMAVAVSRLCHGWGLNDIWIRDYGNLEEIFQITDAMKLWYGMLDRNLANKSPDYGAM